MNGRISVTRLGIALAIAASLAVGGSAFAQAVTKAPYERASMETNATILAAQIMSRWAPIARGAGVNLSVWQEQFATQLGMMSVENLQWLDHLPVKSDASAATNYAQFSQMFRNVMTNVYLEGVHGKGNLKLGSSTTDQVFIPITPCRVVDTRNVGGALSFGAARNFYFYAGTAAYDWGNQGGPSGMASTTCPGTVTPNGGAPSAAVATITVVSPSETGNFVAWGGASPVPLTSVLNWRLPGDIAANTTIIPAGGRSGTGPGGAIADFAIYYNGPSGVAQVVVDVVGYFVENKATALECVYPSVAGTGTIGSGAVIVVNLLACPTGYTMTGVGCFSPLTPLTVPLLEASVTGTFQDCLWANNSGSSKSGADFRAQSACCRVPGQ